jgi:lysozyme
MSSLFMVFNSIQKRIVNDTNRAIKIYRKREKIIPEKLNSKNRFIVSLKLRKIKKFYKKSLLPFIEEIEFDINSFIVNIIPRIKFITKNRNNNYSNSIKYLESLMNYLSKSINKTHIVSNSIANSKNLNEVIEILENEQKLIDDIYKNIEIRSEELMKQYEKSDRKRFFKIRFKRNLGIASCILISALTCTTCFALVTTHFGTTEFNIKNINPHRTISIAKTTFTGNIKLCKEELMFPKFDYNENTSNFKNIHSLRPSDNCLNLIKKFENLKLDAYLCPAGVWTIGYGHTRNVKPDMRITKAEAERLFQEDVFDFKKSLEKLVKVDLTQSQYDALLSLVFNIGEKQFASSTLLKNLNSGNYKLASNEFSRWVYSKGKVLRGLERRRAIEKKLFEQT